jgi:uncharacterized protein YdeI (YjbR/CyaY-like superfamily)
MNPAVDNYLSSGCGRCPLGGTPDCKVHLWPALLEKLRAIVLDCGLQEELKWGAPCYTYKGKNVVIIAAFKHHCVLSFFKGALLNDEYKLLTKAGENTQSGRVIKFTSLSEITENEAQLKAYIFEAIEVERQGLKVTFKKQPTPIPEEFQQFMNENPNVKAAFEALTPGRQRGYLLHFSEAKLAKTKIARIEKCTPLILQGKGIHDHYRS